MSSPFDHRKYRPFAFAPHLPDRTWPNKQITQAPRWVSVDLRDGNQALIDPMTIEQKLRFFKLLVDCGFKEIEIGFPAASQIEFDFTRRLIEEQLIPDDVTVQVLVQAREHLIHRTFEALQGVKRAIVHVYNSTSRVQRDKVYAKSREEITAIAVFGANMLKDLAAQYPQSEWIFQYSPESFSQTEPDFAVEICEAVCQVWQPWQGQQVILNLPSTVEASTPNLYADQIEYFCRHLSCRKHVSISVHTHNDRGCAIAASELAVMAGADRVEGTLLGNGERTGNMDIMVMAMNLYSQGIDPKLDFGKMNEMVHIVSECNNLPVHPRHPYIGELVFTAFSGSHQDAIKKSLEKPSTDGVWDIAYLPIDPQDIGRSYQDVVRINSQSGKGGIAYILSRDYGLDLPRWLQVDFAQKVQLESEKTQKELSSQEIMQIFEEHYLQSGDYQLLDYHISRHDRADKLEAQLSHSSGETAIQGEGNGAISAFVQALEKTFAMPISVVNYAQHALSQSTDAQAVAYVELLIRQERYIGIAYSHDTVTAMLRATLAGLNQALGK
ncbi:2-isopropylmalate synthase [Suttonella indologenes]|uniref:2-isopropylmalate synthase n=1 Tax=Suttonella indologenes TaxID=13276 RepID=A0A380N2A7_9GAMM|nr:2-isopropylmalate synthase [Suttonella indologenes]SUO98614.1 2-isopropylmalate synthase [Suttonella indologenes]